MSDEGSGNSISQNEEQFAFLGRMENIKVFSLLLKAISFKVHLFIFWVCRGRAFSTSDFLL
jgi:hypothetical protein